MNPVSEMLAELAQQGLHGADSEQIIFIAKSVWYSDFMPDLARMAGPFRQDVGYLVDCLARFNVLPKERKLALIAAVAPYKPSVPSNISACLDPLAITWGASSDIMPFMADILPYQTRHYAAGW